MANPLRDMSLIMQVLLALAITVVLVVVGVYVPGSPVAQERDEVDKAVRLRAQLNQEVTQLQVYRQRKIEILCANNPLDPYLINYLEPRHAARDRMYSMLCSEPLIDAALLSIRKSRQPRPRPQQPNPQTPND